MKGHDVKTSSIGAIVARWVFPATALGLLLFSLVLRGLVVDTLSIHWDEYYFLSQVYALADGEQTLRFQTFHGHLYSWLLHYPGDEVAQIIAGRWSVFVLGVIMAGLLAYIGHRLLGGSAGLFAGFVFGSFWFVQQHGASFRYDGIIAELYIATVALLVCERRPRLTAALAGVLGSLALLVSIKSVFYLPTLIIVAAAPFALIDERRVTLTRSAIFGAVGVTVSGVLFAWHQSTLLHLAKVTESTTDAAQRTADKVFNLEKLFPRNGTLLQTLRWDTPSWSLIILGIAVVGGGVVYARGKERAQFVRAFALALPLVSIALYRNSWAYFYVSVLPGACLLAGGLWRQAELAALKRPVLASLAALLMAVPVARTGWLWYDNNHQEENAVHRDIVAGVHEIFPEPVAYIDRCAMVPSFPKVGLFMSSWVMEDYRRQARDIMPGILSAEQPKLLINNIPTLDITRRSKRGKHALRPRDFALLKEHFIHHWGSLWVAGRTLSAGPGDGHVFTMLIGGKYTLEGESSVEIDGRALSPGDVVDLSQGEHRIKSLGPNEVTIELRYGDHLYRPDRPAVRSTPLFRGFGAKRPADKWDLFGD